MSEFPGPVLVGAPWPSNTRANDLCPPALCSVRQTLHCTEWRKLARAALSSEFAPLPPRRLLPLPPRPLPPRPLLPISLSSPDYIHPPPFKYLTLQLFDDDDDDNIDKAGVLNILKPVLKSVEHFCHLSDNSSNDQFRASTSPSSFFFVGKLSLF